MISSSSRLLVPLFGLILAWCFAARADAQTQAILAQVADQWPFPARVISVDLDQSAVAWEIRPPIDGFTPAGPVAATSDGRYTVWSAWRWDGGKVESALFARETASGAVWAVPLPAAPEQLLAHPRRIEVYALTDSTVITIDESGLREAGVCASQQDASLAMDGSQLFILCAAGRVIVLNTATMSPVREVVLQDPVQTIQVSADGRQFAAAYLRTDPLQEHGGVGLYDAVTGDRQAFSPAPPIPPSPPIQTGRLGPSSAFVRAGADRQRLYVGFRYTIQITGPDYDLGETQVFDFDSLTLLGKIEHDTVPVLLSAMAFTPDGRHLVGADARPRWCSVLFLNLESLAVEQFYQILTPQCRPGTAVASPPLAPTNLSATVANRRVTLDWALPAHSPAATSYVVEVRLTAGGPLVGTFTSVAPSLGGDGVPAGTYYVRIRALNALGSSATSAEHVIAVH